MLRSSIIILGLSFSAIVPSAYADTQRFTVVGNGVIFALAEPTGWKMDTNSVQNNRLPVVYYPSGQNWKTAPTVMYANTAINDCRTSFEAFISKDIHQSKSNSPKLIIKEGGATTVDGKKVIMKLFSGDKYGNSEAVAYLDNNDGAFISITLTSRSQQQFDEAFPVFKNLVSSFQFVGNSISCSSKAPSFSERIAFAKAAEKQNEISNYLYKEMFPSIGPNMSELMKGCLAKKNASVDKFTIVANVKEPGQFKEIDFEPKSNTASCFADGLASLHLPPIKPCSCGSLPVVMDMSITP